MDTYLGLDVLRLDPDSADGVTDNSEQGFSLLDPGTGVRTVYVAEPAPTVSRQVALLCQGRAAVAEMRAFVDTRKGRAVPFWLPTNRHDLVLTPAVQFVTSSFYVKRRSYQDMLSLGSGRAHILMKNVSLTDYYVGVIASDDQGAALDRELVTIDNTIADTTDANTVISFLRYCRLGEDRPVFDWITPRDAVFRFTAVEIPSEAPVPV